MQTCSVFTSLLWFSFILTSQVLAFNSNCAASFDLGWQRDQMSELGLEKLDAHEGDEVVEPTGNLIPYFSRTTLAGFS
jgi:hypothetical protein